MGHDTPGAARLSWQAHLVNAALRLYPAKARHRSVERERVHIQRLARHPARHAPPWTARRGVTVTVRHEAAIPVYTVSPRDGAPDRRVFYLHGGAYTAEITSFHWRLITHLARTVPAVVEVPIYPLAPRSTAAATVPAMADLLERFIARAAPGSATVMGDSAGGGMALAVAMALRDRGGTPPACLVLISPWLDVTMSDPRQRQIEPLDHMLGVEGPAESGRLYAGELDVRDPRVSPLFGDPRGLAPMVVFSGTCDLLNTDARTLAERAREAGVPLEYHEAAGMQHVYPLLPMPEGRAAREVIARRVRG